MNLVIFQHLHSQQHLLNYLYLYYYQINFYLIRIDLKFQHLQRDYKYILQKKDALELKLQLFFFTDQKLAFSSLNQWQVQMRLELVNLRELVQI